MASRRTIIFALSLFSGSCSEGAQSDLQYIKQARSLSAEWAMVNELDAQHRLNRAYVDSMHQWLAHGLKTVSQSLSQPQSNYGAEIKALSAEQPGTPASVLRAHSERLKRIEDQLESA